MPFFLALRAAIFGLLGKSSPYKSEVRFFIGAKLFWAEIVFVHAALWRIKLYTYPFVLFVM